MNDISTTSFNSNTLENYGKSLFNFYKINSFLIYDDFINDYIIDSNDIEIIQNNKNNDKNDDFEK